MKRTPGAGSCGKSREGEEMKKRAGWKTTRNLYNSISRDLAKAAAATNPVAPTAAPVPRCWDCDRYPIGGRARGECTLQGLMVNGRSENRPCFQGRTTL